MPKKSLDGLTESMFYVLMALCRHPMCGTDAAEEIDIARVIILAETLGLRAHVCHVSTRGGVQLLREAKKRGVRVTAETCPHYFSLTDDVIMSYDANTKVNPPLREAEDVAAIKEGLRDGTLDCIVTDHAPHHRDEKLVEYNLAAFGISGIETSFSLSYTNLVLGGVLTLPQLAEEFRHYSNIGGQVFISTHSPDFLNAIHLDELYCLVKSAGYTKIVRASDLPLVVSLCQEGDLLGSLWSQGILLAEASKAGGRRDEAHIPFGGALHEIPAG